jgi:hypothetical protein
MGSGELSATMSSPGLAPAQEKRLASTYKGADVPVAASRRVSVPTHCIDIRAQLHARLITHGRTPGIAMHAGRQ